MRVLALAYPLMAEVLKERSEQKELVVFLSIPYHLYTRVELAEENRISTQYPRLQNTMTAFRWRTTMLWNSMPGEMRGQKSLPIFNDYSEEVDN